MTKAQRLTGSVRRAAEALDVDRSILARVIAERGIKPAGREGGHPVFFLSDLARAIRDSDPDRESPNNQLARARAARERLKFEQEAGRLCPVDEVRRGYAEWVLLVVMVLETLPDILERDVGLPAIAIARTEKAIDGLRLELYRRLAGREPPQEPAAGTDPPTTTKETHHA